MEKRKYGAKIWIAIVLIVSSCLIGYGNAIELWGDSAIALIFALISYLPYILAIVLIYYDHKFDTYVNGRFTLLCKWTIILLCVEPISTILLYASLDVLNMAKLIGAYIMIIISITLIVIDGYNYINDRKNTNNGYSGNIKEDKNSQQNTSITTTSQKQASTTDNPNEKPEE